MNIYHPYPDDLKNAVTRVQQYVSENPLFLDTETTGLGEGSEICEIAILDLAGQPLINTLVKTNRPIPEEATAIHGITNEMISNAPTFGELYPRLDEILKGRCVLVYNARFDEEMLESTARLSASLGILHERAVYPTWWHSYEYDQTKPGEYKSNWHCAMKLYAAYFGEWNSRRGSYRWQTLSRAAAQCEIQLPQEIHRAHADAELTRRLVLHMATYGVIRLITQGE